MQAQSLTCKRGHGCSAHNHRLAGNGRPHRPRQRTLDAARQRLADHRLQLGLRSRTTALHKAVGALTGSRESGPARTTYCHTAAQHPDLTMQWSASKPHLGTRQQRGQPRQRLLPTHCQHAIHAHVADELQGQAAEKGGGSQPAAKTAVTQQACTGAAAALPAPAISVSPCHMQSTTGGAPAPCPSWPGR